jgi:hypothetical protein
MSAVKVHGTYGWNSDEKQLDFCAWEVTTKKCEEYTPEPHHFPCWCRSYIAASKCVQSLNIGKKERGRSRSRNRVSFPSQSQIQHQHDAARQHCHKLNYCRYTTIERWYRQDRLLTVRTNLDHSSPLENCTEFKSHFSS